MSITLLLSAVSAANFEILKSDPRLIHWLFERAALDPGTTLKDYYINPEELDENERNGLAQIDGFELQADDFFFIDYLHVSRELERLNPPKLPDPSAPMITILVKGLPGITEFQVPARTEADLGDDAVPFQGEGELAFSAGYDNCAYWSPSRFATEIEKPEWRVAKELEPELDGFIQRVLERQCYVLALAH